MGDTWIADNQRKVDRDRLGEMIDYHGLAWVVSMLAGVVRERRDALQDTGYQAVIDQDVTILIDARNKIKRNIG
jgi:hypothetical protein